MVGHTHNPSPQETQTERSQIQSQTGLHKEILSE
jgi:hypothetical protein